MINPKILDVLKQIYLDASKRGYYKKEELPNGLFYLLIFVASILLNDNFVKAMFPLSMKKSPKYDFFLRLLVQECVFAPSFEYFFKALRSYLLRNPYLEKRVESEFLVQREFQWTSDEITEWMFILDSVYRRFFLLLEMRNYFPKILTNPSENRRDLDMRSAFAERLHTIADGSPLVIAIDNRVDDIEALIKALNDPMNLTRSWLAIFTKHGGWDYLEKGGTFCWFCVKHSNKCTKCKLCNKHFCECCKDCKVCRLCTSCDEHDSSACNEKLKTAGLILARLVKKVCAKAALRKKVVKNSNVCAYCRRDNSFYKSAFECGHHFCINCVPIILRNNKLKKCDKCPLCLTSIDESKIMRCDLSIPLFRPFIPTPALIISALSVFYNIFRRKFAGIVRERLVDFDGDLQEKTCVICLESFRDPKILRCGHVLCRECILGIPQPLRCPCCRNKIVYAECKDVGAIIPYLTGRLPSKWMTEVSPKKVYFN